MTNHSLAARYLNETIGIELVMEQTNIQKRTMKMHIVTGCEIMSLSIFPSKHILKMNMSTKSISMISSGMPIEMPNSVPIRFTDRGTLNTIISITSFRAKKYRHTVIKATGTNRGTHAKSLMIQKTISTKKAKQAP